jgi:tetratricopeptide (TPR) repeat protein
MSAKRRATLLCGAILSLSPALAWAGKPVMVFMVSDDKAAENAAGKLTAAVEEALSKSGTYEVASLKDAAGEALAPEAKTNRKLADADLDAGKKAFVAGELDSAEEKLRLAIKELEAAAPSLEKIDGYVDALTYLAGTLQLKSKEDDARDLLDQALAIRPAFKPEGKLAAGPFLDLLKDARKESRETHHGSVSLYTTPAGGKVYVDGELKGFAPLTVDRLPVGKHLFRFERAGYMNVGQFAEVSSTDELAIRNKLVPTKDFADYEDTVAQAVKESGSATAGAQTWKLMSHYKLDRAIIGIIRTSGSNLVLELNLMDGKTKHRLAKRRNSFEGEEYGSLNKEVARLVSGLLADAEDPEKSGLAPKKHTSRDPLDNVNGTEDWDEDNGPKPGPEPKKKGKEDE